MGFFRGGLVLILGILLFFSFLIMNSFFILSSSLKYDNVKEGLYPIVQNASAGIIPEELLGDFNLTKAANKELPKAKNYCRQNNNSYAFNYEGYAINISCQDVLNSNSSVEFINETYNDVVYDIYYKEYDCNFWNCFSKTGLPFFLVSEKARDYWKSKLYFSLLASLILITLIFLLVEQKQDTPIIVGVLLVLSAFPLLKLKDLLYFLAGKFSSIINLFLSSTHAVFLFSLILGVFLVGAGIALKILTRESIKKKFSKRDVEEIVKKEINRSRLTDLKEKQAQQMKKKTKK